MDKKDKTKLELIRLEGIRCLIREKISSSDLKIQLKNILQIDTNDAYETLNKLNRSQLIKIIEASEKFVPNDINLVYEQYRYGLKPGFTIYSFVKSSKICLDEKDDFKFIDEKLKSICYYEDSKFKKLDVKNVASISSNTYEYSFTYLSRYTYISEYDEPDFVYELKDCFVWINIENRFLAIKNCPNDIQNKLIDVFSKLFGVQLYNIRITKNLISKIFTGNIKKGTFIKPDANDDEVTKITIADERLSQKRIYSDVASYDVSNTFLDEQIDENTNSTLGINCKAGKIYLTKNVNATQFRNWSIECINKITCYLNDVHNCKEADIFKSRNILANTNYGGNSKNIVEEICFYLFSSINNEETSFSIKFNVNDIRTKLKKQFYCYLYGFCNVCGEETSFYCSNCNSSNVFLLDNKISCSDCGFSSSSFACDEGHSNYIENISKNIYLIPKKEFIDELNMILYNNFGVRFDGSFTIDGNYLNIHKNTNGQLIDYALIDDFKKISEINNDISLLERFNKIKEKCKKCSNVSCSTCNFDSSDICIMKLFIGFGDYRPSPHQAQEFGDVNFKLTFNDGMQYNFVGIAKSKTRSGVLNLADNGSREMIQQIITMSRDKRVDLIGAICPSRFHDQLKQELEYIARITGVKIVVLDDIFMCKLLAYYEKNR